MNRSNFTTRNNGQTPIGGAPVLRTNGLSVRCGVSTIVSDVSLQLSAGGVLALYGPSGSGKSTTLLAICGLLDPSCRVSGEILLRGRELGTLTPEARGLLGIAIVLQGLGLFPHLSVLENIAYPLRRRGVNRHDARERSTRAIEEFRLAGLEHRQPSTLSGGEQQRVALARAMVSRPDVLLLDEPFKGLDQSLRDELLALVLRMATAGTSILLVTHEKRELELAADVVAGIRGGRIESVETRAPLTGGCPPFRLTGHRVRLPATGDFAGGMVESDSVQLLLDEDLDGAALKATVLDVRALSGETLVVLCSYETGEVGWLEAAFELREHLVKGRIVGVRYTHRKAEWT